MCQPLDDLVALVTGAGGDIGRAISQRLGAMGARVCLVGRTRDALEVTARGLPGPVSICTVDLTAADAPASILRALDSDFERRLDILVHCAGIYRRGATDGATLDDFRDQFAANVLAPYQLTQTLLPLLTTSQGQVVFINSTQGLNASPSLGQFAATQHALRAFADSLRAEINDRGVRVSSLHIGRTATRRQQSIFQDEGRNYEPELLLQAEDVAGAVAACLALPRTAEVTTLSIRPMVKSY